MSTNLNVQPLGSDLDLEVAEQDDQVSAAITDQNPSVNLTVADADSEVALTVIPDDTEVSLSVDAIETPVALTVTVDETVSIAVAELAQLPDRLLSPTLTYNPDGTVATVTYADGTVKTFTWTAGLLTQVVTTASGGGVVATRSLSYNGEDQLVSVVDS